MTPPLHRPPSFGRPLTVRAITEREHLDFIRTQRSASFLQTPAWGQVKSEWRRESLGWFRRCDGRWSALRWCSTASCRG